MVSITAGRRVILNSTIPNANAIYHNAMTGTTILLTLAMQKTKQQFREHYRKRFPESKEKFQIEYEWLKGYDMKQIMQLGIAFHFLPVRYNYVQMPEDYWWTSLKEYELRYRSGIIRPEIFLTKLAGSQKQALRKIKALHRQAQPEGERLYRDVSIYKNVSEKKK